MSKIKYLCKRIFSMDYKKFFKTINDVHNKSRKNRIYLFFDIVLCGLIHQAGYMDYQLFEMYKMNHEERKTIVTRGRNNELIKKFNNQSYAKYLRDKTLFNEKFSNYLNREWFYLKDKSFEEFKSFVETKDEIMVKPTAGSCGQSIEKINLEKEDLKNLYKRFKENNTLLIEEVAKQCKEISKIHPTSVNTVRAVTLNGKVVVAFLRIGNHNNVVDNFNHGGMAAPINIANGKIEYPAIDKEHNLFKVHPLTNENIVGFTIPKWEEVKNLCEQAAKEIPEIGYAGWDVCVGSKKPFLIEGNEFPGHDIYQLPPHRKGNTGLYPMFLKNMEERK